MKLLKKINNKNSATTFKFSLNFKELLLDCVETSQNGLKSPENIIVSCLHK